MAAAPADYRPEEYSASKIKSETLTLRLVKNPDIAATLGRIKDGRKLVVFSAETDDLIKNARAKLAAKARRSRRRQRCHPRGSGFRRRHQHYLDHRRRRQRHRTIRSCPSAALLTSSSTGSRSAMVLEVIVDISTAEIDRPFDYEGDDIPVGSRVAVPFGPRRKIGFVIGKKQASEFPSLKRAEYIDTPVDEKQLELAAFMRKAYNLRYIDVLRLLVPPSSARKKTRIQAYISHPRRRRGRRRGESLPARRNRRKHSLISQKKAGSSSR